MITQILNILTPHPDKMSVLYEWWTDLVWAHTARVEVGITTGRVNGVLFKVFTDVLWGGLRQQPVDTLPEEQI